MNTMGDIFLIIEMADSSLEYDQEIKMPLYAETGVPEYWIADIRNDRVIVYSEPRKNTFNGIREHHRGETVAPRLLPDCAIPIDLLLP